MKIIIMGCGRVGSHVSQLLVQQGHEVTVIDHDATALARLGPDFKGGRRVAENDCHKIAHLLPSTPS